MTVLGIDIGTQSSVLATINRGAVTVVRTELADRLTPSLVLFSQGHRLMGDHAAPLVRSQANACCRSFKNLLGELYRDSPRVANEKRFQLAQIAEAEGGVAGFRVVVGGQEKVFSASRICAAFLTKLKQVAELSTQRAVGEVVIACPSWFREANREALLDAANIAGLTCLRVISDMTATALDYGLYRRQHFTDSKTIVAFVSVGHSTASVCIAAFTSAGGEILAEVSNPDLGGRDMDLLIAQHFAGVFEKQHGMNPLENIKAKLKLEDQAERTKKVLSANSETTFAVECLMEDHDLSGLITRELFEELCADSFKPSLLKLLHQALSLSGLEAGDIAFVEAVGGCTRIPWVQRCIAEAFGREISRTLSGDECVARGCALQAAMASLHFKVKEFDFGEKLWNPISISWSGEAPLSVVPCSQQQQQQQTEGEFSETVARSGTQEIELPIGTPTNTLRKITFNRDSSFDLRVAYKDLGKDNRAADLGGCRIELPPGCGLREVHVFCAVNYNGIIRFPRACMKQIEEPDAAAPPAEASAAAEGEQQQQQEQEQQEAGEASAAASPAPPTPQPVKVKPIELKVRPLLYAGRLTERELQAYRESELQMSNEDRMHREKQDRLNELETSVYSIRDGLAGSLGQFASEEEKQTLGKLLEELETWIYDHQDDPELSKSAIIAKIDALKQLASPIQYRQQQRELRQVAAENLRKTIQGLNRGLQVGFGNSVFVASSQDSRQAATSGSPDFAHIEQEKMQQLLQAAEADEAWLNRVMEDANAQPLTQDPSVTSEAIEQRRADLYGLAKKILSTPKPKMPSQPAPPRAPEGERMDVEEPEESEHGEKSAEKHSVEGEEDSVAEETAEA